MGEFNRPDRHRLGRVHKRIEKALNFLAQAHGEMRPAKFRWIKNELDQVMATLDTLQHQLSHEIDANNQQLALDGAEPFAEADALERQYVEGDETPEQRPKRGRAA